MRKFTRVIAAVLAASLTMPMTGYSLDYTDEEYDKLEDDMRVYVDEIKAHGKKVDYDTDRFYFANDSNHPVHSSDYLVWQEYFKRASNIETAIVDTKYLCGCLEGGRCLGMSIASVLAHNGIFSPSDMQEGRENLVDIRAATDFYGVKTDPVMAIIQTYQLRQLAPDFQFRMYNAFAQYDRVERVDELLDMAQRAEDEGRWFLICYDDDHLSHAVAGLGMMSGEFIIGGKTYDKCILTYDSNFIDKDTDEILSSPFCAVNSSIFVDSETREVFAPAYFMHKWGEDFKVYCLDDCDYMNYHGTLNPSDSYTTDISQYATVEVLSGGEYTIEAVTADGEKYDGISECGKVFKRNKKSVYNLTGQYFTVQNTAGEQKFSADMIDPKRAFLSSYDGSVSTVTKDENGFRFDVSGETKYDVSIVFEECSYDFAPHFRYDLSGVTDSGLTISQSDKGVILSGKKGVQCSLKTRDITRDENGFIEWDASDKHNIILESNIRTDGVFAANSVMIAFDGDAPAFYIGESYENRVQKGDVNCDGFIDASDASFVLQAYSALSTGGETYLSPTLGDYNSDGKIDASDASCILKKYADLSTE